MFARIYHLFWTCLCWHKMQEGENCFLSCTYLLNKLFSLKTHFGIIFRSSPIKKKKRRKKIKTYLENVKGWLLRNLVTCDPYISSILFYIMYMYILLLVWARSWIAPGDQKLYRIRMNDCKEHSHKGKNCNVSWDTNRLVWPGISMSYITQIDLRYSLVQTQMTV